MKAILLGIVASLFFASTFVLNRAMNLVGGSWIWSAVLRYLFMILPLLVIVLLRGNLTGLILNMKKKPTEWLLWSTIGFGLFYAPICYAAAYGPSWLVASTWQITIVAGSLLVPFFTQIVETESGTHSVRNKIPTKGLSFSVIILIGVAVVQVQQFKSVSINEVISGILPVVVAAFAYPMGNRKMMEICGQNLDTFQRVLGMTIASMPFWLLLSIYGFFTTKLPSQGQISQSVIVAITSGVIATLLFFKATDLTRGDVHHLAAVEATQSGEVLFSLLGELIILKGKTPTTLSFIGMALVVIGMIIHSYYSPSSEEIWFKKEISG